MQRFLVLLILVFASPAFGQSRPLGSAFNSANPTKPLGSAGAAVAIVTPNAFDTSSMDAIDATYRQLDRMAKTLPMKDRELFTHYLKGRLTGAMDVAIVVARATDKATAERYTVAALKDLHGLTAKEYMATIQPKGK